MRRANRVADIPLSNGSLLMPAWRCYIYGLNRTKTGTLYVTVSEQRGCDFKRKKMTRFRMGKSGQLVRAYTVVNSIKKTEINIQLSKKKKKK